MGVSAASSEMVVSMDNMRPHGNTQQREGQAKNGLSGREHGKKKSEIKRER
jgi:hypothetical protein